MEVFWMFRSLFVLQEPEEVVETESSDWWIDSESEKLLSRSMSNDSSKTWEDVPEDSVFEPYENPIAYLPLFCLATYKMQGDLWRKTGFDQDRLIYLQSAADSWLKQLSDDHHDNNFFINF
ncbi:unnamed protein product [Brassica rapa]|uniref:Uncharacterized protein n=2 Tax=Brassica TaxID=3705 RepID=A0A3P6BWG4_BRACM|nr:unnamed protein product [Brassica napus]CAG7903555.1 unnamed protein product [Brassica rapa]VDD00642.1 unnamed protein product [Brassica rapa]